MLNFTRLPGLSENDLAITSSLRRAKHSVFLQSNQSRIVNNQAIGGASSAAVSVWTAVTQAGVANDYGGTLVAQVTQASPVAGTIRLRVCGVDVFGQDIVEESPVVVLAAKTNNFIYLATCMTYVRSVEYQSTGLDIAGDKLFLGTRWDWTRTIDATNEHIAGRNLGIPLMMRSARRGRDPLLGQDQRMFSRVTPDNRHRLSAGPGIPGVAHSTWGEGVPRWEGHAKALFAGNLVNPINNDTITIGSVTYRFRSVLAAANDVQIGGTWQVTMDNLRAAILARVGGGTLWHASTVPHPQVTLGAPIGLYLEVIAKQRGAIGNLLAFTRSITGTTFVSGSFLGGGYDMPAEVLSVLVENITDLASATGVTVLNPLHYLVGYNEDGWQGVFEKLHIPLQSYVSGWGTADNVRVHTEMRSLVVAGE